MADRINIEDDLDEFICEVDGSERVTAEFLAVLYAWRDEATTDALAKVESLADRLDIVLMGHFGGYLPGPAHAEVSIIQSELKFAAGGAR